MIRTLRILGVLVLVLQLGLAASAVAQTTGTIRGQIKDQSGDPLPGVTVTATNVGRGTTRTVVTGENGSYSLPSLAVDNYSISAMLDGFRTQKVESVRVGISQAATIDLVMEAMELIEETLIVTASQIVDTSSASVSSNYGAEFFEDLPTTRNFWDMMAVSPGVVMQQTNEA